jgi:hypothetical protein
MKMEMKEEVKNDGKETLFEKKDGIWQFPSCLIQDVTCIKEEVEDEIKTEEGGVYCEAEEKSSAHIPFEAFHFLVDTVGDLPLKVQLTEGFIGQEWGNTYVKELGEVG